ncbi:MAG: PTS transporter subunit EIIA [Actinobacteria bacterium]|nr:PTS transporter subunit EIIA [Actinomycetota bacterium]
MKLSQMLSQDAIVSELRSSTRNGVLSELVDVLVATGGLNPENSKPVLKALIDRETHGSTGLGKGVAVPHCQHSAVKRMVMAVGRSTTGVEFNALDKAPVYLIFLLLSPPDDQDRHLQAMELIFRPLQRATFRKWLRQADTPQAIMDCIVQAEDAGAN